MLIPVACYPPGLYGIPPPYMRAVHCPKYRVVHDSKAALLATSSKTEKRLSECLCSSILLFSCNFIKPGELQTK